MEGLCHGGRLDGKYFKSNMDHFQTAKEDPKPPIVLSGDGQKACDELYELVTYQKVVRCLNGRCWYEWQLLED